MHKIMKQWTTKAGLEALVLYVNESHNCGYVELPEQLKGYNFTGYNGDGEYICVSVHGGITYQDELPDFDNKYVVGFDCAHYGDKTKYSPDGIYRSVDFCDKECEKMAVQLLDLLYEVVGVSNSEADEMNEDSSIYKSAYSICYAAQKLGTLKEVTNPYNLSEQLDEHLEWDRGREDACTDYFNDITGADESEVDKGNAKVRVSKDGRVYIPSGEIAMLPEVHEMQKQAEQIVQDSYRNYKQSDITLRDHFAGQVLLGELSNENGFGNPVNLASYAYSVADAMLKIRNE